MLKKRKVIWEERQKGKVLRIPNVEILWCFLLFSYNLLYKQAHKKNPQNPRITTVKTKVSWMIHFDWPPVKTHQSEMISQLLKVICQGLGIFKDLRHLPS